MGQPNALLRAAREATESTVAPGEGMSRRELAEAVNAYLWQTTGQRYDLDAHQIARWERGAVRWPSAAYRSALRAVLGVASDAELGFRPQRTAVEFRGHVAPRVPAARETPEPDGLAELNDWVNRSAAVDAELVTLLNDQTNYLRTMDAKIGAVALADQMSAHLSILDRLLSHAVLRVTRRKLASVLADAAALAGWMALDRGEVRSAWRHHEMARPPHARQVREPCWPTRWQSKHST